MTYAVYNKNKWNLSIAFYKMWHRNSNVSDRVGSAGIETDKKFMAILATKIGKPRI